MKSVIIYNSHRGTTKIVVKKFQKLSNFSSDVINLNFFSDYKELEKYQLFIFFTPTYGDRELHQLMEDFIEGLNINLKDKYFIICELGNYVGYEDLTFGPMKIIRDELNTLEAIEFAEGLSLDSTPGINWNHFSNWINYLNIKYEEHV